MFVLINFYLNYVSLIIILRGGNLRGVTYKKYNLKGVTYKRGVIISTLIEGLNKLAHHHRAYTKNITTKHWT